MIFFPSFELMQFLMQFFKVLKKMSSNTESKILDNFYVFRQKFYFLFKIICKKFTVKVECFSNREDKFDRLMTLDDTFWALYSSVTFAKYSNKVGNCPFNSASLPAINSKDLNDQAFNKFLVIIWYFVAETMRKWYC